MWVRGRRGVKPVEKAMDLLPSTPGTQHAGRGGAPAQGRVGGTAHREVREEQHFCQGSR